LKSVELQITERAEIGRKNGKSAEVAAIMSESPGKFLERKLGELDQLVKPFLESIQESEAKNKLVESFRVNFNMTEAEARIAAGVERSHKNDGYGWDILSEAKGK
jgi:ATP-dependent RNA circularization protein (DNA/RNA ligase family)